MDPYESRCARGINRWKARCAERRTPGLEGGCSEKARKRDLVGQPTLPQPHDQGGRTCACNAGARSRACHRVKQSKGWNVTQPRPGWHQWETPSGRVYTQEPKRYPA
jgi:hypothetical protein